MKKILSILLISLLLASCQGNDNSQPESSSVSVESVETTSQEVSEEKESWTEKTENGEKTTVTEYSNYGKNWKETITENKDGVLVYKQETVVKDQLTTTYSEWHYSSDAEITKAIRNTYEYKDGKLVKKTEITTENGNALSTETEYNDDGTVDSILVSDSKSDGSKTVEHQEFDYEENTKDTTVYYYEKGDTNSSYSEYVITDLDTEKIFKKWISTKETAYGENCSVTDYHHYENGEFVGRKVKYRAIIEEDGNLDAVKIYNADNVLIWEQVVETEKESKHDTIVQYFYKAKGYYRMDATSESRLFSECVDGENEIWFLDCDFDSKTNTMVSGVYNADYCTAEDAQSKLNEIIQLEAVYNSLIEKMDNLWN